MGQAETKEVIIPELRNSTPTVKLVVQHASKRVRKSSGTTSSSSCSNTPSKTGLCSTLPVQKHVDQSPDMLLPEALWSDAHPSAPIAYRFGTVVLPAPTWISWSEEKHFVTLTKLANGFGFSIMDYKEPKQKGGEPGSVLIIRQITPFGAADLEGHLALGERIVSVNGEPITNHSIEDIVGMIKPCNVLQLKMCRPVESEEWKSLLNTNISAIPLVSGPRSITHSSSQEAISTSTLNVARGNSYQSLNSEPEPSFSHQPIIRHQGDTNRHHGDTNRHLGNNNLRSLSDMKHGGRHYSDSSDEIGQLGSLLHKEPSDLELKPVKSYFQRSYSSDRSSGPDLSVYPGDDTAILRHHGDNTTTIRPRGDVSSDQSSGTIRRRYQPAHQADLRSNGGRGGDSDQRRRDQNGGYEGRYAGEVVQRQPRPPERDTGRGQVRVRSPDVRAQRYTVLRPTVPGNYLSNKRDIAYSANNRHQEAPYSANNRHQEAPYSASNRYQDVPYSANTRHQNTSYSASNRHQEVAYPSINRYQETTFGTKQSYKKSHSSGSNSEIQSIISSVSGINNNELTELWRKRTVKSSPSKQLSRV